MYTFLSDLSWRSAFIQSRLIIGVKEFGTAIAGMSLHYSAYLGKILD
ncbi:MAG: hypothetical protein SAL07_18185 [Oscillatoria sp. PMC 1051.18]|nr:hypothetical protein [Oscillatoria salina]MBZ8179310.1 hypothetical protein [Oscillatoria salina IIICB1]MEC4894381.1 hypothetical protein [Oscillatoria sp. PMC 1050.18]MEC5031833.1 hypothetical protein [Oscillatoria sp. PMC 1051.18]NET87656.1 hypothetical protein [Kamptonema sp. SIO1D9]